MSDKKILDWLQMYMTAFRQVDEDAFNGSQYCLEWITDEGFPRKTIGCDLRDCVCEANSV